MTPFEMTTRLTEPRGNRLVSRALSRTTGRNAPARPTSRKGFSLAEILAALTIGAMILVAVVTIYHRAERAAGSVIRRLDKARLPSEVLQRITEDIDRMVSPGSDTKITVGNKRIEGYAAARLQLSRTILDSKNKEVVLEQIIWQAGYDIESTQPGLVLYRSHSGISLEDKLLDNQRADWEKQYPFVPVCGGVSCFRILIPHGDDLLETWDADSMPKGLQAIISFAEPIKNPSGIYDVPEEEQILRTIVPDRTRKIQFEVAPATDANDADTTPDPNTQALQDVLSRTIGQQKEKR